MEEVMRALKSYRQLRESDPSPSGAVARADLYVADEAILELEEALSATLAQVEKYVWIIEKYALLCYVHSWMPSYDQLEAEYEEQLNADKQE